MFHFKEVRGLLFTHLKTECVNIRGETPSQTHLTFLSPHTFCHSGQSLRIALGLDLVVRGMPADGCSPPCLLHQPWRKCHDSAAPRLPQYHREITLARMNRLNSNGSPALFMHADFPDFIKAPLLFRGGESPGGMSEAGVRHDNERCEELMHFLHYWTPV